MSLRFALVLLERLLYPFPVPLVYWKSQEAAQTNGGLRVRTQRLTSLCLVVKAGMIKSDRAQRLAHSENARIVSFGLIITPRMEDHFPYGAPERINDDPSASNLLSPPQQQVLRSIRSPWNYLTIPPPPLTNWSYNKTLKSSLNCHCLEQARAKSCRFPA